MFVFHIPTYTIVHQGFHALSGVKVLVKLVEIFYDMAGDKVQLNKVVVRLFLGVVFYRITVKKKTLYSSGYHNR